MKKGLLIKICILTAAIQFFSISVFAFEGNEPHTQTLIVTSQILDDDGKLIDPEGDSKANQDTFTITVHFSNLNNDDEISYSDEIITPDKDGTAEVTYETGNCTPQYFDNVPVTAKIIVTEAASSYRASYETYDFVSDGSDSTEGDHMSITTEELLLKEGKDGFVLFSNKKAETLPEATTRHGNELIIIILILFCFMAGILIYRHRCHNE